MQLVNSAQFLNVNFLSKLSAATAAAVFATVMVPTIRIYASLETRKLDLNTEVLNLI